MGGLKGSVKVLILSKRNLKVSMKDLILYMDWNESICKRLESIYKELKGPMKDPILSMKDLNGSNRDF